mmetsp:Transcript_18922/g.46463  ORF Transcript_18922/g.46463 Transcript_18922/m.46463 type:complete len:633 (-) Transcript_18922:386-2284(-)|eukprot:CAMPEP_0114538706 /NCGR_PEP_ID=MMETSP0109-20121206/30290_1 /TAXON_ID=29199 /ORGANISM="Chlorarachnion reptans, Strain CCCM449" /LENGTH=632 /DNA_ID=CAMNT_0001722751 /DNA_START=97 /DNA_END=1995 /DNA_ORIENTATION=+
MMRVRPTSASVVTASSASSAGQLSLFRHRAGAGGFRRGYVRFYGPVCRRSTRALMARRGFCEKKELEEHNQTEESLRDPTEIVEDPPLPSYRFFPEDPKVVKAREEKMNDEIETIMLEEEERAEKDKNVLAANEQALLESKKFANRNKEIVFEERPYESAEDDPNPLSPDDVEIDERVLERIVSHARQYSDKYLEAKLFFRGGDGRVQMQDPNYRDLLMKKAEEQKKKTTKGQIKSIGEEIDTFWGTNDPPILSEEEKSRFNLDLYENIEKLLRYEEFDNVAAEKAKLDAIREGQEDGGGKYEDEDANRFTVGNLPERQKHIANKMDLPYMESFTRDGDINRKMNENREAVTEQALDWFEPEPKYDEFDEFRIKYGLDMFNQKDTNPFHPAEAIVCSSGDSESEPEFLNSKEVPIVIQADTLRMSGPTQEILYQLHMRDQERFTPARLGKLFEIPGDVAKDIIEMKQEEKEMIKNGEFTTGLEWYFVEDFAEYSFEHPTEEEFLELPYTQMLDRVYPDLDEKKNHSAIDEIQIEKYREWDAIRIQKMLEMRKGPNEVKEYAAQFVPGKEIDVPKRRQARFHYVFTDLTLKKRNLFRCFVREKNGILRNGTTSERLRAIRIERPKRHQYEATL